MSYNRSNAGAAALVFARQLTGKPYIFGGTWPQSGGTDCDGLVVWAYGKVGIHLVRPTETTYREFPFDDRSQPNEVGDLLFIPGDPSEANPGHVVMYVSPGQCFEAEQTGTLIGQRPFDTNAWEFRTRPALALPLPPPPPKPPKPKPTPVPKPVPHPEDHVTTTDISVKIAASGEGTTTVPVPFAKVLAAFSLAGAGPNDCGHPSIASSGSSTVVVVRGAKANTTQDVRLTVAD